MFILAFFLPGLVFLLLFFGGRQLGRYVTYYISLLSSSISYIIIVYYLILIVKTKDIYLISLGTYLNLDFLLVHWGFLLDISTILMCFVIATISLLVLLYSIEYMSQDPNLIKFFSYLQLFIFFMYLFISSENFIQMFFGWEGIGICSYLLIIFWDTRISAKKAAIKAILVNKIGDLSLLFTICLLFLLVRSTNIILAQILTIFTIPEVFFIPLTSIWNVNLLNILSFTILLAVFCKSAQIGLHIWLPDAMEGPTPVSALLHAATMVTAGVFLTLRFSVLIEISNISYWYMLIGGITALYAAILGFCQEDIKKSIAYSTCSQLGYMILSCGFSEYDLAFFHLFNHAFFKALLFLSAGYLIHNSLNEQDLRILGGYSMRMPFLFVGMLIGGTSLLALPFLAGFFSKELIINLGFFYANLASTFSFFFCITGAIFTVLYTFINTYDLFIGDSYYKVVLTGYHKMTYLAQFTLLPLIFLSIWSGFIFSDIFIGAGSESVVYFQSVGLLNILDLESINVLNKYLPLILSISIGLFSLNWSDKYFITLSKVILKYLSIDEFLFKIINRMFIIKLSWFSIMVDRATIEFFGPLTISKQVYKISYFLTTYLKYHLINYIAVSIFYLYIILVMYLIPII